ncbi:MAG: hypothetical protein JJU00_18145 [Opitutales bacterium]|nr:hypothetical protein [Opitutales bacterium]
MDRWSFREFPHRALRGRIHRKPAESAAFAVGRPPWRGEGGEESPPFGFAHGLEPAERQSMAGFARTMQGSNQARMP